MKITQARVTTTDRYVLMRKNDGRFLKAGRSNNFVADISQATLYKTKHSAFNRGVRSVFYLAGTPISMEDYYNTPGDERRLKFGHVRQEFDREAYEVKRIKINIIIED